MPRAVGPAEVGVLGEGQDASRRADASVADHHRPVVQGRTGYEQAGRQAADFGVQARPRLHEGFQGLVALTTMRAPCLAFTSSRTARVTC